MNNQYNTLVEAINSLSKQGYNEEFYIKDEVVVKQRTNRVMNVDELKVDQFHKVEGLSDPADGAIVVAISTNCGHKGLVVDGYGPYSTQDLSILTRKTA